MGSDPSEVDDLDLHATCRPASARVPGATLRLASALLGLTACVAYEPAPLRPAAVMRELDARSVAIVRAPVDGPWRADWFPLAEEVRLEDGLTLPEALSLALFYGPRVRSARVEAGVAAAQVLQAGLLHNPQLFVGPRISAWGTGMIIPAGIGWNLPLWGQEDTERAVASARWSTRALQVIDVELEALLGVRERFLRIARQAREADTWSGVVDESREVIGWVERLAAAGQVDPVVVYLARVEFDAARAAQVEAAAAVETTRRDLFAAIGMLPDAPVEVIASNGPDALPELPGPDPDVLLRVPSLVAAEAAYAAAEAELELEVRRQYPVLQFGPQFESDFGDPTIGAGLQLNLPLFDRNRGSIAAAERSREGARAAYSAALLEVAHEASAARASLATAERLLTIHREGASREAESASRALAVRLRAGMSSVVEVLAAQRTIAGSRVRRLALEERAAVARLRAAVAGGFALRPRSPGTTAEESR